MARTNPIPGALAALFLAALAGASCSTFGQVSLDEFVAENARLFCKSLVACGDTLDEAACERGFASSVEGSAQSIADVASGKVIFDGSAAAECLDYRRRHEGDCDTGSLRADPARNACNEVFVGALGVGEACFTSDECQTGSCSQPFRVCNPSTGECPCTVGTCKALAGLGEDCRLNSCERGLACSFGFSEATNWRCEPRVEAGEVCTALFACVDSVVCVRATPNGGAVCGVPPAEGERCTPGDPFECARRDDWCDPEAGICKRRLPLGAPCVARGGSGSCVHYASCNDGKCSLPPREGEPSPKMPEFLFSCGGGLSCVDDVCVKNGISVDLEPPVCK